METVVTSILPLQFEKLGTSNTAIALIMTTIPMIITAVANPIISFKSDRYRSWKRYGGDENYIPPVPGETMQQRLAEEMPETEIVAGPIG